MNAPVAPLRKRRQVYIEITNVCNQACAFCPGTTRPAAFMTPSFFESVMAQLPPLTEKVYLHVMGEPLLHLDFQEIIAIAQRYAVPVEITTNGSLLAAQKEVILNPIVRQINLSLHRLEHAPTSELFPLLETVRFLAQQRPDLYINLRFWLHDKNIVFQDEIESFFNTRLTIDPNRHQIPIAGRIFLHCASEFSWPESGSESVDPTFCPGLSSQFAVLCDGTLVPCCLDRNGTINLGNLHTDSLRKLLSSERACRIMRRFADGEAVEDLCRGCTYRLRFAREEGK